MALEKEMVMDILKETGVLKEGHFILTSGKHSNRFMQMAQVLQYPEYTETLCQQLVHPFKDQEIDIVISPAVGGILVGYEAARALGVKNIFCEREQGKMTLRRGFELNKGQKVLVVEDVVTTGGSVKEVIKVVEEAGAEVVGVGVLVDRSNGTIDFGYPFTALLSIEIDAYEVEDCPLCEEGKIPAIKPGSRGLK